MPARSETADQKAQRLSAQSHKLRVKSDYVKICGILRQREDLIARFKTELISLGELVMDQAGAVVPKKQPADSEDVKGERGGDENNGDASASSGMAPLVTSPTDQPCASPTLHRNFRTWSSVPPKHIMSLLAAAEPVALNTGNMRAVIKRGCKVPPKALLLECLEYIADLDPSSTIPDRDLGELTHLICSINRRNGRPARDLTFPLHWPDVGHFELLPKPPCLQIRCRATDRMIVLPGLAISDDCDLAMSIDGNYSRARASLVLPGKPSMNIAAEFARQNVSIQPADVQSTSGDDDATFRGSLNDSSTRTPPPKRSRVSSPLRGSEVCAGAKTLATQGQSTIQAKVKEEPADPTNMQAAKLEVKTAEDDAAGEVAASSAVAAAPNSLKEEYAGESEIAVSDAYQRLAMEVYNDSDAEDAFIPPPPESMKEEPEDECANAGADEGHRVT